MVAASRSTAGVIRAASRASQGAAWSPRRTARVRGAKAAAPAGRQAGQATPPVAWSKLTSVVPSPRPQPVHRHPQLKAAEVFLNLQEQLTTTEDKVEFSRRFYNGNVRDFNTALQTFPTNLYGRMLGFQPFAFFAAAASERGAPTVQFASPPSPT